MALARTPTIQAASIPNTQRRSRYARATKVAMQKKYTMITRIAYQRALKALKAAVESAWFMIGTSPWLGRVCIPSAKSQLGLTCVG